MNAKDYAIKKHQDVNHLYDGKPYHEAHLQSVVNEAISFFDVVTEYLIENNFKEELDSFIKNQHIIVDACWCHDIIEDARETYSDVKNNTSIETAEIVFALTNEKGKTIKARANDKYYNEMKKVPYAVFVKLCDRIANVKYSMDNGSKMFMVYKNEHKNFKTKLFSPDPVNDKLWEYLDTIFK